MSWRSGHRLLIRRLMRQSRKAALGTCLADTGAPYVSLVTVATDQAGNPLLLLSSLSDHSRNIAADPRVSLLFDGTEGYANPQEGPRATLLGTARRTSDDEARRRFLACHPGAGLYAGFGDFAFWRVDIERVHWVGGFARALWIEDPITVEAATAGRLALGEPDLIAHMNADHADAVRSIATGLAGRAASDWRLVAGDADGVDIADQTSGFRMSFEDCVVDAAGWRDSLRGLATRSRGNTGREKD